MIPNNYSAKFTEFSKNKLFQSLDQPLQVFIQNTGESYGLTFQELNQLTEIAVDYHMWNEPSIEEKWNQIEPLFLSKNGSKKKAILGKIKQDWVSLKENPSTYENNVPKVKSIVRKVKIIQKITTYLDYVRLLQKRRSAAI